MNNIFKLLVAFVAIFLLLLAGITAMSAHENAVTSNNTEVQDVQDLNAQQIQGVQKPFIQGQWGIMLLIIIFMVGAVIAVFIKSLRGKSL